MRWCPFCEDSKTVASSLPQDAAIFGGVLEEHSCERSPLLGQQVIAQKFHDVIDEEDTELQHIFSLAFNEHLGKDVVDEVIGESEGHGLVGLEESTNQLRNGDLDLLLLLDLVIDHLFLLLIEILVQALLVEDLLLIGILQQLQHLLREVLDLLLIEEA